MAINLGINAIKELNLSNSKIRKAYLGNTKIYDINKIPANYTKVNFVKNTGGGNSGVDIDILFDWNWTYEIDYRWINEASFSGTYEPLLEVGDLVRTFYRRPAFAPHQYRITYICVPTNPNQEYSSGTLNIPSQAGTRYIVKFQNVVDNTGIRLKWSVNDTNYGPNTEYMLNNRNGNVKLLGGEVRLYSQVEVYNLKLYDGDGILKCNLVPVKRNSDNAPGFYDLVRRRFFTADFLIAGDVLPYDEEIEYLESTGGAYIDTNVYDVDRIEIKFSYDKHTNWGGFFSNYIDSSHNSWRLIRGSSSTSSSLYIYVDCDPSSPTIVPNLGFNDIHTLSVSKTSIIVDGVPFTGQIGTQQLIANTNSIQLFKGDVRTSWVDLGTKFYYFKAWKNNVLAVDLIAVRVGQVGYMYDKVSNQLFGNAGTGDFILGPDI